ncbi:DUF2339 domain-containing protein [Paenibacillus sp. UMB4589-SE434]|uniref:DUF2339 domain-containing protein n=1 Tax=Paenibacillus sp. UMB4589-SE434 TaxID=3046314 RepID=UPI00254C0EF8|nr:DUF2339 domain-containing protein [Paenibacillus sp. UMB4589-SE434]MDK8182201.1 DUF2339 domain-containing protein [Paenibacillus sp. UMB4589-SE434]
MDVEKRIERLESKVRHLEQELELLRGAVPDMQSKQPDHVENVGLLLTMSDSKTAGQTTSLPHKPIEKPKRDTDWEHLLARVWLPRIFIVVLLLGVLWGFMAAVSAGIITEPIRCALGIVAAVAMYILGLGQMRSGRVGLGQVLLGGANVILVLSLFAAHMLYGLIPSTAAFLLYVLSIGIGVWTATRYRSQTLIITMMLSGYLVPFLVVSASPNPWGFAGYETILSIILLLISVAFQFRIAASLAVGMLHVPLFFAYVSGYFDDSRYVFMLAVVVQHAVFFLVSLWLTYRQRFVQSRTLFAGFVLMAMWLFVIYAHNSSMVYPAILAAWSILYTFTAIWVHSPKRSAVAYIAIATLGWLLWLLHIVQADYAAAAVIAEGAIAFVMGVYVRSRFQQIMGAMILLFGAVGLMQDPIMAVLSPESLSWIVLLTIIPLLYQFIRKRQEPRGLLPFVQGLMWAEALLILYFITQLTETVMMTYTYDLRHLVLSGVWIVYAITVIIIGVTFNKRRVRLAGLLFLFLTLVKIIFVDMPGVSVAVRAVLFIGLGAAGIVVSRLLYRQKSDPAS